MRKFAGSRRALLALLLAWSGAAAAEPMLAKVDLFTAGEGGYALYRIPCLVVSSKGTLLALCEARKSDKGDWGSIDILLRRSSDEGKTWSAPRKVAAVAGPHRRNPAAVAQKLGAAEDVTYNNPVAIVDRKTGAIHLLFCLEYMRCFYQRSDDDGLTFSRPVEITAVFDTFRPDYDWKVLAAGPGHGIQLAGGRLLVPVWLSTGTGGHAHRPSVASVIYSDDHGASWRRGDIAVPHTQTFVNPSEAMLVERADGSVMLNVRSESAPHRRLISVSKDGASGWSTPAFHDNLVEPICMASLLRLSQNRLLFANPANLERGDGKAKPGVSRDRKNLSVRLSLDDGKSWPLRKTLEPGPSAYSDLALGAGGTIYCLYERGSAARGQPSRSYTHLTLARFNLEWLFDGSDRLQQR